MCFIRFWPTDVLKWGKNSEITSFVWSDDWIVFDERSFSVYNVKWECKIFLFQKCFCFVSFRFASSSTPIRLDHKRHITPFLKCCCSWEASSEKELIYESNVSLRYHLLCCIMVLWVRGVLCFVFCIRILCFVFCSRFECHSKWHNTTITTIKYAHRMLEFIKYMYICKLRIEWMSECSFLMWNEFLTMKNCPILFKWQQMNEHVYECINSYWVLLSVGLKPLNCQELNARMCLRLDIWAVSFTENSQIETHFFT